METKEQLQTAPEVPVIADAPEQDSTPTWKAPKKKRRWPKVVIAVLLVLAALFFFVIRPMLGAGKELLAGAYLTSTAQMQEMTVSVSSTGTIQPIDSYNVSGMVTGEVLESPFEVGDQVEKGDVLYRIDPGSAETALQQAQLSVQQAQLNYDSIVDGLNPKASGAGVVQKLHVKKGDLVSAGSPIADISDTSTMTLTVPFQSADAQRIAVGSSAQVTLAGTLETLTGTVESVANADLVGNGGALVRQVKIRVQNPGALTTSTTATAKVGSIACAGSGTFEANLTQTVVATGSGEVVSLNVSAGSRVSAGQVLATLGGSSAQTSLENASISLQNAQLSLQNAQDALDNYTITAPISGTVIEKNFKAGDTIDNNSLTAAGGTLAVLYDMSTLTFEMKIDEKDINKVQVGQEVTITADAVEGVTFSGVVDTVNINGTTVSGQTNYPVTVVINDPQDLKPGMNVSADIIVERAGTVLCVPVDAVNRGSDKPTVQVAQEGALDENGNVVDPSKLETREVTLGRNDNDNIEITSGLSEGEIVVWVNEVSNPFAAMMGM
ncbi:MAG: efflux RND transporter periplasmic adaptor subunit [Flintibacter sp.]|uniref:efflux RND transporter periplasmic adaptor subunit n=1 Tax=Flintibacter sp. TaxID=1918624 RepID=UPI0026717233|nr:efflux RND transporter periplasmic adaptor subunit [Flintibacter sp.]MCI6150391.1 efflux RND transporter periplasmic adaptor subunit [Flintibacter sp.]MDY5038959.1 efflux RND transporter periplasmic adaptor subunit [Lawsonibacter sp.]